MVSNNDNDNDNDNEIIIWLDYGMTYNRYLPAYICCDTNVIIII